MPGQELSKPPLWVWAPFLLLSSFPDFVQPALITGGNIELNLHFPAEPTVVAHYFTHLVLTHHCCKLVLGHAFSSLTAVQAGWKLTYMGRQQLEVADFVKPIISPAFGCYETGSLVLHAFGVQSTSTSEKPTSYGSFCLEGEW